MGATSMALLFCIHVLLTVHATTSLRGSHLLQRETPNAFEVYAHMKHIVAISDSNNDTIFECYSAKRSHFDRKAREVTYVVEFNDPNGKQKKKVAFHITAGPTPSTVLFTNDEHPDVLETGDISYTNYINCFVSHFPYMGEQCVLFVSKELVDDVPEECVDQFGDICGVAVQGYNRDLCPDDEEDF